MDPLTILDKRMVHINLDFVLNVKGTVIVTINLYVISC